MTQGPRGAQDRIHWFLQHKPCKTGMCAQHSWHALGGDHGNPPPWGCVDANQVYDKVRASGKFETGDPPFGALVLWKYGHHGHAALAYTQGMIATTDSSKGPGTTGKESITYPHQWGASPSKRIWTNCYNGVEFEVGGNAKLDQLMADDIDELLGSGQLDGDPCPLCGSDTTDADSLA